MTLQVINAKYLGDYRIEVEFTGNITRVVDLSCELDGEIFEPLKHLDYFKTFHLECGTISWGNGADIAPEYLFLISKPLTDDTKPSAIEIDILLSVQKLYGLAS